MLDELVAVVLSQNTSDVNSSRAFQSLKTRFPDWQQVADAPTDEVADAIRSGGIANLKAARIKTILAEIERREGSLDLSRLDGMGDQEVEDYLRSLPGVGPKSAACVLVFSMGRPVFPVDTHVHRVLIRLGWVEPKASAERAYVEINPRVPPEIRYDLHVAFIRHGRQTCKAAYPRCTECVLLDICDAGPRFLAEGLAR